ncbi:MAG: monomeric [FeFe] hydrogenase, partial [Eubacteriales bacterium]|nr:monomeric [FeFe] hydrogenase [Eubacteriales bacterium]
MNPVSEITKLRRNILTRVARWALNKPLDEQPTDEVIRNMVMEMIPDGPARYRCCIYKERAVAEAWIRIITGLEASEQVVTVIPEACNGCSLNKYFVTDACQNCVAHSCRNSCPKKAISVLQNRAYIDNNSCVECGICAKNCPYHAIVEISRPCERSCDMGAIKVDECRRAVIDLDKCVSCGMCVAVCPFGAITDTSKILDVVKALRIKEQPMVAIVAPSLPGQFGPKATPGHIKTAILKLGFDGVVEAALGADVVAKQDAEEIRNHPESKLMTNSCCPAYAKAVTIKLPEIAGKISDTPSPMRVTGRLVKERYANKVTTVFIGPCIAKKAEATLGGEIDMALTFEELSALFAASDIDPANHVPADMNDASPYGRLFAKAGGVSAAVTRHLPDVSMEVLQVQGIEHGLAALRSAANALKGTRTADSDKFTFIECMACEGGCVGGPGTLVRSNVAARAVEAFSNLANTGTRNNALGIFEAGLKGNRSA